MVMPYYRVTRNNAFGEGWRQGEIIEMDYQAARVRLEEGDLEFVSDEAPGAKKSVEVPSEPISTVAKEDKVEKEATHECVECKKMFKNAGGLNLHKMKVHQTA